MTIIVKLIIEPGYAHPHEAVMEMIREVFGEEEQKEKPRAKLILIQLEEK